MSLCCWMPLCWLSWRPIFDYKKYSNYASFVSCKVCPFSLFIHFFKFLTFVFAPLKILQQNFGLFKIYEVSNAKCESNAERHKCQYCRYISVTTIFIYFWSGFLVQSDLPMILSLRGLNPATLCSGGTLASSSQGRGFKSCRRLWAKNDLLCWNICSQLKYKLPRLQTFLTMTEGL